MMLPNYSTVALNSSHKPRLPLALVPSSFLFLLPCFSSHLPFTCMPCASSHLFPLISPAVTCSLSDHLLLSLFLFPWVSPWIHYLLLYQLPVFVFLAVSVFHLIHWWLCFLFSKYPHCLFVSLHLGSFPAFLAAVRTVAGFQIPSLTVKVRTRGAVCGFVSHGPSSKDRELLIKVDHTPGLPCFNACVYKWADAQLTVISKSDKIISTFYIANNCGCGQLSLLCFGDSELGCFWKKKCCR